MPRAHTITHSIAAILASLSLCGCADISVASSGDPQAEVGEATATGKRITPTAAHGAIFQDLDPGHRGAPEMRADHAAAVAVSPDGRRLAILTSGYNRRFDSTGELIPELSTEYVFLFDITSTRPRQIQALPVPNTHQGLAWSPSSDRLFVSGGSDDVVVEFSAAGPGLVQARRFELGNVPATVPAPYDTLWNGVWKEVRPVVGGVAISPDGSRLLVANTQNDSVSMIDVASGKIAATQDLRPGKIDPTLRGTRGGTYPRSVVWASPHQAYVGSERDRELISLSIEGDAIKVRKRIAVPGRPVALITSKSGARLFAALSSVGEVVVLDTAEDRLIERFSVLAPPSVYSNESRLGGVNSNALALTPDGRTLLVSNGGQNSIAVVKLSSYAMEGHARNGVSTAKRPAARDASPGGSVVVGLVPTGWYPTGVATSSDGRYWYIVNGKSPPGPIAEGIQFRLQKGGFLRIPAPGVEELTRLTRQVARNNGFDRPAPLPAEEHLFAFLRAHIKHVIYITKENRSYDQVLGDLEGGNGDARFAAFPERITPNHHALARYFVTLDHYVASAEGSWTGEQWCLAAGATDFTERHDPLSLAGRKVEYAYANTNRFRNMAYPNNVLRKESYVSAPADDPDTLVGAADVAAPDGPGGEEGGGYLWDAAIRAGLSVRNYGMFLYYPSTLSAPLVRDPFAEKIRVAYSGNAALIPHTSPYFRGYDERFPDFWRVQEWKREFDQYVAQGNLPGLTLMTLPADHFGSFDEAIDGLNTQQRQMADNDYALGQVVEAVANSPFADSTLIIAVEDGPFGSPDHVEASRAPLFFAGPYVRRGSVISSRYTTPDLLKTIEAILGLAPLQLNDALAAPMSEIFDPKASAWSYEAIVPDILRTTQLPLPPPASKSTH